MKNIAITIFFLAFGTFVTAQEVSPSKSNFKINILSPGIGWEYQIAPSQTFSANLNLAPQFSYWRGEATELKRWHYFGLKPGLNVEYRFYLNRQKRLEKGRSTYNNSGFYLGSRVRYSTYSIKLGGKLPGPKYDAKFAWGGVIGYQKTFNSNLQMGFNVGYGMEYSRFDTSPTLMGTLNLSYALRSKKRR